MKRAHELIKFINWIKLTWAILKRQDPDRQEGELVGAMDDQKIQLESKLDYDYVKSNFLTYMKSIKDSNKFSIEELEQVSLLICVLYF